MKEIPLSKGHIAQVDDADFDWLSQWKWHWSGGYAARNTVRDANGRQSKIWLHKFLLGASSTEQVDHKDGNTLNCQRGNLRRTTSMQNRQNVKKPSSGVTSKFKGVCRPSNRKTFKASIDANRKKVFLGYFHTEIEAAAAYNEAAIRLHGEFARLNELEPA